MKKILLLVAVLSIGIYFFLHEPDFVEYQTTANPEYAILLLHGRGGSAEGIISLSSKIETALPADLRERVIYTAINGPHKNIIGYTWETVQDQKYSYVETEAYIKNFIEKEIINKYSISEQNIIVIGFSAGGSAALYTTPFILPKSAGIISIGASSLQHSQDFSFVTNKTTKILLIHGSKDLTVDQSNVKKLQTEFSNHGFKTEMRILSMGHEISDETIELISEFLGRSINDF